MASSGRGTTTDSNILKHVLGIATYTAPSAWYAGLYSTTATADNGTFTELSSGTSPNYARVSAGSTPWNTTVTTDSTGVWTTNNNAITYSAAGTGGWVAATGFAIFDASTSGNALYWGTLGSATTVGQGATASFAAAAIKVTEA